MPSHFLPLPKAFPREKREKLSDAQRAFWLRAFQSVDIGKPDIDGPNLPSPEQMEWFKEQLAELVGSHWAEIEAQRVDAFFAEANVMALNLPGFYPSEPKQKEQAKAERVELSRDDIPSAADVWVECRRRRWNEDRYDSYAGQKFAEFASELAERSGGMDQLESGLSEGQQLKFMLLFDTLCLAVCEHNMSDDPEVWHELTRVVVELRSMAVSGRLIAAAKKSRNRRGSANGRITPV